MTTEYAPDQGIVPLGQCRRNAPAPVVTRPPGPDATVWQTHDLGWPITRERDWCGQFARRKDPAR